MDARIRPESLSGAPVLIVDDSDSLRALLLAYLRDQPWRTAAVGSAADALRAIDASMPALILLDMQLPDSQGMPLFHAVREHAPDCAIIVITAYGSIHLAVEAIKSGALDFLEKPVTRERLVQSVRNGLERVLLERRMRQLDAGTSLGAEARLLGNSLAMRRVRSGLDAAAASSAPVMLLGERGTGARLAARLLHGASARAGQALVEIECEGVDGRSGLEALGAAMPGGTLALHDVECLAAGDQAALLRLLEVRGEHGEPRWRVVSSSQLGSDALHQRSPLRRDLLHRLHVVPIALPPLRQRENDAVVLAHAFLSADAAREGKAYAGLDDAAAMLLRRHPWPGNVAQLRNTMREVAATWSGGVVTRAALPEALRVADVVVDAVSIEPLWVTEQRAIRRAIAACGGDHAHAAQRLGLGPDDMAARLLFRPPGEA